ncbi:hypothetical protein GCM10009624_05120 [Gordonia sinesedis]
MNTDENAQADVTGTPTPTPGPTAGPTPGPRPGPHLMPGAGRTSGDEVDADVVDAATPPGPELAETVTASVRELLAEVDEVRRQAGDEFSLAALGRQTELLERAHTVLTDALAEVDRR